MEDTIVCERCGSAIPASRMKEVMYEQDRRRVTEQLCPSCLDAVMRESLARCAALWARRRRQPPMSRLLRPNRTTGGASPAGGDCETRKGQAFFEPTSALGPTWA